MNPEDWKTIEEIYHAALEVAPGVRAEFLAQNCASDEVRREVESLLGWQPQADDFIETQALNLAAELLTREAGHVLPGIKIGVVLPSS